MSISIIFAITGLVHLLAGYLLKTKPPQKINKWYGYRTPQSLSSQEKWDFAQGYSAKFLLIGGLIYFILALIVYLLKLPEPNVVWVALTIIVLSLFPILLTEKAMRNM